MRVVGISEECLDDFSFLVLLENDETLLDNIRRVLAAGEVEWICQDQRHDVLLVLLAAVLEDMLNHVISVGVLNEGMNLLVELVKQRLRLRLRTVFEDALHHAAAVAVNRHVIQPHEKFLDDEPDALRRQGVDALLDDVIPMLVLNAFHDVTGQLIDERDLLVSGDLVENLLHDAAAVEVHRKLDDAAGELLRESLLALDSAVVENLLYHATSEGIGEELVNFRKEFTKKLVDVL